jgi:hypothetical protein
VASTIKVDTIQSTTSNVFFQNSAGTEYARFDASGNMGLGVSPNSGWTTSNGRVLELTGNGSLYGYNSGGVYSTMIGSNIYWDGTNWKAKTTGTTGLYQFTGSTFAFYNSPSTSAGATTSLTSVLSNQGANNTVVLQGGASSAGIGIAFPATQSASSDANTLDDYEEGTWTPSVFFGGAAVGQTGTFAGFYTKVGNQVFATFLINLTAKGSSTGSVSIGGLPFTSNSNSNYRSMSSSVIWATLATNYVYLFGLISANSSSIDLYGATAATADNTAGPLSNANINNTSSLRISITYQTS